MDTKLQDANHNEKPAADTEFKRTVRGILTYKSHIHIKDSGCSETVFIQTLLFQQNGLSANNGYNLTKFGLQLHQGISNIFEKEDTSFITFNALTK